MLTDHTFHRQGPQNPFDFLLPSQQPRWSDPVPLAQMSQHPFAAMAAVFAVNHLGQRGFSGTAWFVSSRTLVTAAHVVNSPVFAGVEVAFGPPNGRRSFPNLSGVDVAYFGGSPRVDRNGPNDLAALTLRSGQSRDRIQVRSHSGERQATVVGLPGDAAQNGSLIRFHSGPVVGQAKHLLAYDIDTNDGQSGGPVLFGRYAAGLHLAGRGVVHGPSAQGIPLSRFNAGLAFSPAHLAWLNSLR